MSAFLDGLLLFISVGLGVLWLLDLILPDPVAS